MKIVIEIPDQKYNWIVNNPQTYTDELHDAIRNGIPLPKGHGRLIDADMLRSMYSINRANFNTVVGIQKWIDNAPTIIEAEGSDSE